MKKNLFKLSMPVVLLSAIILIASCKKDNPVNRGNNIDDDDDDDIEVVIPAKPEDIINVVPKTANDNKSGGVYKATLVGSTGSVKLVLDSVKAAYITFDNVVKALNTTDLKDWKSGDKITNATFTADGWTLVFSVDADGKNPVMKVTIPNHTITVVAYKETTQSSIITYEGTYKFDVDSTQKGTLNFIIKSDTLVTAILKTTDAEVITLDGKVLGNNITLKGNTTNSVVEAYGILSAAEGKAFGSFTEIARDSSFAISGSWAAGRKL